MARSRGSRNRIRGVVIRDSGAKTITVSVVRRFRHPRYEKMVRRDRTIRVHDEHDEAGVGDQVEIVECRPMSRTKRWRLARILKRSPEAVSPLPQDVPEEVMRPTAERPAPEKAGGDEAASEEPGSEEGAAEAAASETAGDESTPEDTQSAQGGGA